MNYFYELGNGQKLEFHDESGNTYVGIGASGRGQQQRQGYSFSTGAWSRKPDLFVVGAELILQIHTKEGDRFLKVRGNQIDSIDDKPDLAGAKEVPIEETSEESSFKPMKPMEPMKPMAPMKPMEPMKPMRPMGS